MATPNYNDPRAGTNAFSIGQQELLRLKNRIGFIEEAFEKLDDDPTDAIPTKLSELQNDVGFITADDIPEGSGGTVPTKTSDLTNDSGFITNSDRIANMETWKNDQSETFGSDYTIRAVWNGDVLTFKCVNPPGDTIDYWVTVPYAERVPWTGVMNAPEFVTRAEVEAMIAEALS